MDPHSSDDARDLDTMKWLGQVIESGTPTGGRSSLPAPALTQDSEVSANAAALATEKIRAAIAAPIDGTASPNKSTSSPIAARTAAARVSASPSSRNMTPSASANTLSNRRESSAAHRASQLAAAGANDALYHPRAQSPQHKPAALSNAGAAASLAHASPQLGGSMRNSTSSTSITPNAAGRAALLAANDPVSVNVPKRQMPAAAGTAALLAHRDSRPYKPAQHELSENAGRAALLATKEPRTVELPHHELSASAGTAALRSHEHPVSVELPVHQLSASASTAALYSHENPVTVETPVHKLSASASTAALYSHQNPVSVDLPPHELSSNAGKAALLAHHDPAVQPQPRANQTSAASAANALKAATQAHHDPAVQAKPREDLQAKGAANALRAASQAHREAPAPFKFSHPSEDPEIGALARKNAQAYLKTMEFPTPDADTLAYANISYQNARDRSSTSISQSPSSAALQGANISHRNADSGVEDESRAVSSAARAAAGSSAENLDKHGRSRANTSSSINDLLAVARRNVDSQLAERGLTSSTADNAAQGQRSSTRPQIAHRASDIAFRDGQDRQVESDRNLQGHVDEREISARISREMALFDKQRRQNQNNPQVTSALMEAARRNARLSMQQMDAQAGYRAPSIRETSRVEDLLNAEKAKARKEKGDDRQIDIGGGHFMSQVEIEAVAARRIQPVFDDMDEQIALINKRKEEARQREEAEKARKAQAKAEEKARKEEARQRKEEQKAAERAQKEQAKREAAEAKAAEKARKQEEDARRKAEAEAAAEKRRQEKTEAEAAVKAQKEREAAEAAAASKTESSGIRNASISSPLEASKHVVKNRNPSEVLAIRDLDKQHSARASKSKETSSAAPAAAKNISSPSAAPLPGSNVPLKGQQVSSSKAATTAAPTADGRSDGPIATYQVDNPAMMTDTENETEDEWADAIEETPAVERDDPIPRRYKDESDNVSVATAKPTDTDLAPAIDGTKSPATTSGAALGGASVEPATTHAQSSKFVESL